MTSRERQQSNKVKRQSKEKKSSEKSTEDVE